MDQSSENALLARLQDGDEEALIALHNRYANAVYAVAYRVLGERMAAEEVTQDTFMRLWEKASSYDPEKGRFLTWLLTIARRRAIDVLRSQQRRQPPRQETFSIDAHPYLWEQIPDPGAAHDLRGTLAAELAQLPPEQRDAIELAYFHGMTHSDIAAYLQVPLGTVKTRLRLGMQKLRQAWLNESNPNTDD